MMRAAMSWLVMSRQAVARFVSGEAGTVEFQRQFAQLLAGQLARTGQHGRSEPGWRCRGS